MGELLLHRRVPLESTRRTQAVRASGNAVDEAHHADARLQDGAEIVPRDGSPISTLLYLTFILHVDAARVENSAYPNGDTTDGDRGGGGRRRRG